MDFPLYSQGNFCCFKILESWYSLRILYARLEKVEKIICKGLIPEVLTLMNRFQWSMEADQQWKTDLTKNDNTLYFKEVLCNKINTQRILAPPLIYQNFCSAQEILMKNWRTCQNWTKSNITCLRKTIRLTFFYQFPPPLNFTSITLIDFAQFNTPEIIKQM